MLPSGSPFLFGGIDMEKKYISIFNPGIARHLLKHGYILIDIKPHREIPNASVFVFLNEEGLFEIVKNFNAKKKGR